MKRHKVLEHTADVRLWVEADSIEELFIAAMEGMSGLIKENHAKKSAEHHITETLEIESPDMTSLLIEFLSEILTLSHNKNTVFREINLSKLTENKLAATITGCETDGFDNDIKAVTYHEAEIRKTSGGTFETMIVFDI